MQKNIIAINGGGFTQEQSPFLDLYVIARARKANPKICFLPTASGDNNDYIIQFYKTFGKFPCEPTHLSLFGQHPADMETFLLSQNIIYIGGGHTKNMLAIWRDWGVDEILKKAYEKGIVLAGVSAGSVCWFEQCLTDSIPGSLTSMNCLGILKGSSCPHYDSHADRRPKYQELIYSQELLGGYAGDDGTAIHFMNGEFYRAVSSMKNAKCYNVKIKSASNVEFLDEELIEPIFLGNREARQELIFDRKPFSSFMEQVKKEEEETKKEEEAMEKIRVALTLVPPLVIPKIVIPDAKTVAQDTTNSIME